MSHETFRCATSGCSNDICLDPATVTRLRQTHETFYCPLGHTNYFPGKTAQEKELEQLRQVLKYREQYIEWLEERRHHALRACIWTGCSFVAATPHGLNTHLRATHGMPTLAAVRQREEEAS